MKLLFILFPILVFSQKTIKVKIDYEVVDSIKFFKDKIYICKDKTRIRISKDSIYIYAKHQYLKLKR